VSKHLQILTECQLLQQTQNGREIYYHTDAQKMKDIADFIEPFRQMWDDRFNKLEAVMKKYKAKKFIAYFQNFSNTYIPPDDFYNNLLEVTKFNNIVGISISTRPDCVSDSHISYAKKIKDEYNIRTRESGLQQESLVLWSLTLHCIQHLQLLCGTHKQLFCLLILTLFIVYFIITLSLLLFTPHQPSNVLLFYITYFHQEGLLFFFFHCLVMISFLLTVPMFWNLRMSLLF
jgi:hypothetical protein